MDDWIRLFNATDDEEFAMIKRRTPGVLEAMEVVEAVVLGLMVQTLKKKSTGLKYVLNHFKRKQKKSLIP